jgi:2-polyprenyl-3-methyl-5-hydroxy-6-metoxy-1,4-benzoquinol methylase
MHERHSNRHIYFKEQGITTAKHVIPFLKKTMNLTEDSAILEIGCGEGGNLVPFLDMGCKTVVGVDLSEGKIESAKAFFADHPKKENIQFISEDIYKTKNLQKFDVIITRDVLEHIHDQDRFMREVKHLLKPGGKFFLGFPSWQSPFGGHQQMCRSKVLSKIPYFHILPKGIYKAILKSFKEKDIKINNLLEIKETGISIDRFDRILKKENWKIDRKVLYFIQPNYEVKFGLKTRKQWALFSAIPYFKNYFMTAAYYVVSVD